MSNKNKLLIILSISILIIPDLIFFKSRSIIQFCFIIISKLCVLTFLLSLFLKILKSFFYTYLIIGLPYLISSCIEIINVSILGGYINLEGIKGLYFTLGSETNEFVNNFYIYFILPFSVLILYLFCLARFKSLPFKIIDPKKLLPLALTTFSLTIIISTFFIINSPKFISGKNLTKEVLRQDYLKQHPFNLFYRIIEFTRFRSKLNKYKTIKENFKFEVINNKENDRPSIVILIIGERIRYSNWSINGYNRETNPNLKKIENLISFKKNYSNGNATASSLPLIITQATPQNPDIAFSQKTIVSLYKEAGFQTIWISSQQNCFDFIENKDENDILFELYNKVKHTDLDIIPTFNSVISKNQNKNKLIVINMLGGHGVIPEKFNLFKPNSSKNSLPLTIANAPIFINDYDNMILFQEYVLSEIIKLTERQQLNSILLFTADHGCNLFDNGKILFGYGSANPTEKETHVPLFIWTSNDFVKKNKDKLKNLRANKNRLTTNDNIFYTLADLSNINYKTFEKTKSIANFSYIEPLSRFVYINGNAMEFTK